MKVTTKDGCVVAGRVSFSSPDKFCVVSECGMFWVYTDGYRTLTFLDML